MKPPTFTRREAMALAAGAALHPGIARGQELPDWLGLPPELAALYRIDRTKTDHGEQVTLVRRDSPPPRAHVYVLYSRDSSAYDTAIATVLDVFHERRFPIKVTCFFYDDDESYGIIAMRDAQQVRADLIYTMGSDTTAFAWPRFRDNDIPIVSICSKDPVVLGQQPDYRKGSGTSYAFTSLDMPVPVQFAYLKELKPGLKNLAILADVKNVSAMTVQLRPMAAYARDKGVRVHEVVVARRSRAAEELGELMPQAIAAMRQTDPELRDSVFWVTGSTAVFREIAAINAQAGTVPVLSVVPDVVQEGGDSAVVSIGVGFESNAYIAASYGLSILTGAAKAGGLPVGIVSPPDIAINFQRARAIGLKIPFSFVETASTIYGPDGRLVRDKGRHRSPSA